MPTVRFTEEELALVEQAVTKFDPARFYPMIQAVDVFPGDDREAFFEKERNSLRIAARKALAIKGIKAVADALGASRVRTDNVDEAATDIAESSHGLDAQLAETKQLINMWDRLQVDRYRIGELDKLSWELWTAVQVWIAGPDAADDHDRAMLLKVQRDLWLDEDGNIRREKRDESIEFAPEPVSG